MKIDNLKINGSNLKLLQQAKLELKYTTPELIINNIEKITIDFLDDRNTKGENYITGISTLLKIPTAEIKIFGGKNNQNKNVDEKTLFDIASVTKLFTLMLFFKLDELNILTLTKKISEISDNYKNLKEITINDLLLMTGEYITKDRIEQASNKNEALSQLRQIQVKENEYKYSDIGLLILTDILEVIFDKNYDDIITKYIIEGLNLTNTTYKPISNNLAASGKTDNTVNDPKTLVYGPNCSAGLFTNSEDLKKIFNILINEKFLKKEYTKKFSFRKNKNHYKGYVGLLLRHEEINLAPKIFSKEVFTSQGYTGCFATFDLLNQFHNSILTNAIKIGEKEKVEGYINRLVEYQKELSLEMIKLHLINKDQIQKTIKL